MKRTALELEGLLLFEPPVYRDDRGWFREAWHQDRYPGLPPFVQDNASLSRGGVLRGLHFQHPHGQAKLITVLQGAVHDVVVDVRRGSPTYREWVGVDLSAENGRQLYVPVGFAHGFVALSDPAILTYKCSAFYDPAAERTLLWNDPELAIAWPVEVPVLSGKDRAGRPLAELETTPEALPRYGTVRRPDAGGEPG